MSFRRIESIAIARWSLGIFLGTGFAPNVALSQTGITRDGSSVSAVVGDRLAALEVKFRRAEIETTYSPVFRQFAWGREMQVKVLDVMAAAEMAKPGLWLWASPRFSRASTMPAIRAVDPDGEVRILVGEERWAVLDGFRRSVAMRTMVARFAGGAARLGIPLSVDQAEELMQIISGSSDPGGIGGKIGFGRIDWAKADEAARKLLSAEQMELFQASDLSLRWTFTRGPALTRAIELAAKDAANGTSESRGDPEQAGRNFSRDYPEAAAELWEGERAKVRARQLLLYRELKFSAEQISEFERIELAGPERVVSFSLAPGRLIRLVPEQPLTRKEQEEQRQKLLGRDGYAKFKSGEFNLAFDPVTDVASALCFSPVPLTPEQALRLATLVVETRRNRGADFVGGEFAPIWPTVAKRAREFMAPEQIAALDSQILREEITAELASKARAERKGAGK